MQLNPTLRQSRQDAVLLYPLHCLVRLLSQVESVDLQVGHGLQSQKFNTLGVVEELEQVIVLAFNDVIVHQRRHGDLVLRQLLESWGLHELVVLG